MTEVRVAIAGAGGRMGAAVTRAVVGTAGFVLCTAFERPGAPTVGLDAGTVAGLEPIDLTIGSDIEAALEGVDAVIDFTAPAATVDLAARAARRGLAHIIGTTGCSEEDESAIRGAAAAGARIVKSGNFSLGVNLLRGLVRKAAAVLGEDFDIEIVEMHHRMKLDSPSGTALMLGQAAAAGRGKALAGEAITGREGMTGQRPRGKIGFASLRGGTVVGDHTVIFAGDAERIELTHRADSRTIFAHGATRAAQWAVGQPAGYYTMADVLGFTDDA